MTPCTHQSGRSREGRIFCVKCRAHYVIGLPAPHWEAPCRRRKPLEERFWAKVDRRGPDECWLWNAATDSHGYGRLVVDVSDNWKFMGAHRVAWELANGPIPDGLNICHKCDVPRCCNPAHLFLGTHGDNTRDMVAKGRQWMQRRTHCNHGHLFSPENTYIRKGGSKGCRECRRQRWLKGRNRRAKLTPEQVRDMRTRYSTLRKGDTIAAAAEFGLSKSNASAILRGLTWRNI